MHAPLTKWFCDNCGQIIESPEQGYVIWKQNESRQSHDFRIIHQTKCDNERDYPQSMPLDSFLGQNGLNWLLSFLSLGPIKLNLGQSSDPEIASLDEFVDFFRRVQTPYYEQARKTFSNPEVLSDHADANELAPYVEAALREMIENHYQESINTSAFASDHTVGR